MLTVLVGGWHREDFGALVRIYRMTSDSSEARDDWIFAAKTDGAPAYTYLLSLKAQPQTVTICDKGQ